MARIAGYSGNVFVSTKVVEDCEDAWNESLDSDVLSYLDNTDYMVGSGSERIVQASGLGNGDICVTEVVSLGNMSSYTALYCYAKSTVNITTADDYRLLLDNHVNCASPEVQFSFPTLTAGTWKFCSLPVVAGSWGAATAIISIGLKLQANDPGALTMRLDHIVAATQVVGVREWSLEDVANVMDTTAYSDGQNKVFTATNMQWGGSFGGFKDGPPLARGTIVGLELQESSTSTQMWRGGAMITSRLPANSIDGVVTYNYTFQGIHALEAPTA